MKKARSLGVPRGFLVALATLSVSCGCTYGDEKEPGTIDARSDDPFDADVERIEPGPDVEEDTREEERGEGADGRPGCPDGLQDNDEDGVCLPDCATAGLSCVGHAHCDDQSGVVTCVCDAGFQDKDGDGSCRVSCGSAELDCGPHSHCDDASGTALCACDDGYQDNDFDGTCLGTCATADPCGVYGTCDDSEGRAVCRCDVGHSGEDCAACEIGYQDNDGDGTCHYTCGLANLSCPVHGHCEDGTGEAMCVCDLGHTGVACVACDVGFQDHDRNGTCRPDCDTAGDVCVGPGICDDSLGEATCACNLGYQDHDADGVCLPSCAAATLGCPSGQACEDWDGVAKCLCPQGHAGANCALCAEGFSFDGASCRPERAWSVIVYMSADNDLEDAAYANLAQMMQVGSGPDVDVVVLLDTFTGPGRALHVKEGSYVTLAVLGEPDMGDWRTLRDLGVWAIRRFPAQRYALVLWNHGRGWRSWQSHAAAPHIKGFSEDAHGTAGSISIAAGELGRALRGITQAIGGAIDIVGFDACLMGMWEVALAVFPYADVMVASSENIPASGWPYDTILGELAADPGMNAQALGGKIVQAYHAAATANATLSAVDMPAVASLDDRVNALASTLLDNPGWFDEVEAIRQQAQGFGNPHFKDFRDLASRIASSPTAPAELASAAAELSQGLDAAVIHHAAQSSHPQAHGLSVYAPPRAGQMDCAYRDTNAPWQDSDWPDFLKDFLGACTP